MQRRVLATDIDIDLDMSPLKVVQVELVDAVLKRDLSVVCRLVTRLQTSRLRGTVEEIHCQKCHELSTLSLFKVADCGSLREVLNDELSILDFEI